jgi:formylglycine-generating enzyme required for sulfatase activity
MKVALTGRVDLLRVRRSGCPELQDALAHLLGYERILKREDALLLSAPPPTPPPPLPQMLTQTEVRTSVYQTSPVQVEVPFWQPVYFEAREPVSVAELADDLDRPREPTVEPDAASSSRVGLDPLTSPAALATRLRRFSAFQEESSDLDLDQIVDRLGRGEWLHRLPRLPRRRWGPSLQVIVDRSRRLVPYWLDQNLVVGALARVYPHSHFEMAALWEGAGAPRIIKSRSYCALYRMPDAGTPVVVLTDLGSLACDQGAGSRWWLEWGQRLAANGNPPLALVPCHPARCSTELSKVWTILPWESSSGPGTRSPSADVTAQVIERMLTLFSFVLRLEPRMIRALRRMLPEGRDDAGIEALLWQDERLVGHGSDAAMFDAQRARELRERLQNVEPALRQQVYDLVARMRQGTCMEVWYAELLGLEDEVNRGLVDAERHRKAQRWLRQRREHLARNAQGVDLAGNEAYWFRQILRGCSQEAFHGPAGSSLHALWTLVNSPASAEPVPAHFDPRLMPGSGEPRTIQLSQVGDHVVARPFHPGESTGSPIALIRTGNGRIKIEPDDSFWEGGIAPAWAADWGTDEFGPWAAFQVDDVRQKVRWILPGRFLMGSPDDEAGRYDDEGPLREETIESGFWLFETLCTRALWSVVMHGNRAHTYEQDWPVERVSWDDCHEFVTRLNALLDGLHASLPSEAQWEYACRAGTNTARYHAQLSEIAWYAGNSDGESRPVRTKRPNAWGLYDMLGNLWEWCADPYHRYGEGASAASSSRVVRGGSWDYEARDIRAACRYPNEPGDRFSYLGFRCAGLGSQRPASRGNQLANPSERSAGASGDDEPASGNGWLDVATHREARLPFPAVVPIRVLSDLEQLTFRTLTRPAWASDLGRDRYGLWADLRIAERVRQRLRWIPPGRFLMGSPENEEGRYGDEGPQHEVTVDRGFWMFDTPCTQEVWEAVMGGNPSRFRSPTRPVERVSWKDCQGFLSRLNEGLQELELSLPSEAQWEYACRAGTTTSTHAGNLTVRGENNAPLLDGIAWYGGNCGAEFDLPEGYDTSRWNEKQYNFERGGTRLVRGKQPSGWGLYDMLGNVWEWCADEYRPSGVGEESAVYVLRGGSWNSSAWDVRAAYRGWYDRGNRSGSIGFRCAEFRGAVGVAGGRAVSESERRA